MDKLRPLGLRGAVEIKNLLEAYYGTAYGPKEQAIAKKAVDEIAKVLQQSNDSLLHVFHEIADDPYTRFLAKVWEFTGEPMEEGAHGRGTLAQIKAATEGMFGGKKTGT
jgi:hypothetical protein